MGIIYNMYKNWKEKREQSIQQRHEIPDEETTDKYLRSLRRQRRMQLEEFEKAHLLKVIRQHEVDRANKHLWGIKSKRKRSNEILSTRYNFSNYGERVGKRKSIFRL